MSDYIKERFEPLSDAILAIAMTILVLEIGVPASQAELPKLWEAIGLFLVSFVVLANFWYERVLIMHASKHGTMPAFFLDVLAHGMVALYPLAIKMLVDYSDKQLGIAFFGAITVISNLLLDSAGFMLLKHATEMRSSEQDSALVYGWMRRRALSRLLSGATMFFIAYLFPTFGIYFYLLAPFLRFVNIYQHSSREEKAFDAGYSFTDLLKARYDKRSQKEL